MKRGRALRKNWPILAIGGVLVSFLYGGLLYAKTAPKEAERVNVFLAAAAMRQAALARRWEANKGPTIFAINITFIFAASPDLGAFFTASKSTQDCYLLPTSFLVTLDPAMLGRDFCPLGEGGGEGYDIGGVRYGSLAHRQGEDGGLVQPEIVYASETYDDDYYVFYRRGGKHAQSWQEGADDEARRLWE